MITQNKEEGNNNCKLCGKINQNKSFCSKKCQGEYSKSKRKCKICNTQTNNKYYCSLKCQNKSKKGKKKEKWESIKCLNCDSNFDRLKNRKTNIYCSRKCGDVYKKNNQIGIHDSKNRVLNFSNETKIKHTIIAKKLWESKDFRKKVKEGQLRKSKELGHWFGCDNISIEKRKITNLKKYGVEYAGWNVKKLRNKAENTCLKRYGKHSWEIAQKSCGKVSKIEKICEEILLKNNFKFKKQYKIFYDEVNFKYKKYDFFLIHEKVLIEVDGDYWHGNPILFKFLNKTQLKNIKNDKFKNNLASKNDFKLIRFWENEVHSTIFEQLLLKKIKNEK